MRIVQANAVYEAGVRTAGELLDEYHTVTEWSEAVAAAGAKVSVVQRFHTDGAVKREGIAYELIKDPQPPWLSTKDAPAAFVAAIAKGAPDVVHVNGLIFPQLLTAIRAAVGGRTVIVAQHRDGQFPVRGSGLVGWWRRQRWKGGLAAADALSFTAQDQAGAWRHAGVLGDPRIIEIVEAGTTLRTVDRERARAATGLGGSPLILWGGRLTTARDPLTVLSGLEHALAALPDARAVMVCGDDTLIEAVDTRVRASALLRERVTVAGRVSRPELPHYYGAADVFVSGNESEGSSSSLIEAMSAGLVPVVADTAPFRAIAGDCGALWPAGDVDALATTLTRVCRGDLAADRARVRARFHDSLSWDAIARRTVEQYQALLDEKRGHPPD